VNADNEISEMFGELPFDRFAQPVVFRIIEEANTARWFLPLAYEPSRIVFLLPVEYCLLNHAQECTISVIGGWCFGVFGQPTVNLLWRDRRSAPVSHSFLEDFGFALVVTNSTSAILLILERIIDQSGECYLPVAQIGELQTTFNCDFAIAVCFDRIPAASDRFAVTNSVLEVLNPPDVGTFWVFVNTSQFLDLSLCHRP
jgi:hypothetical protein